MTVELRTQVPSCLVIIRDNGAQFTIFKDPKGEVEAHQKHSDRKRENAAMEKINQRLMSSGDGEAYNRELAEWNRKYGMVYSVFIDGLNEDRMREWYAGFQVNDDSFYKGTRFMGTDRSSISIAARALKIGIPDDLSVKLGVKFKWSLMDVINYGVAVRNALEKRGVRQPAVGYTGQTPGTSVSV